MIDGHTHTHTQATTIPEGQNWPRVKIATKLNFKISQETLHVTYLLKLFNKKYKYDMDPTRTVGATERTWDAGRTDGWTECSQCTPPPLLLT